MDNNNMNSFSIPHLYASGNHYEVGYRIGHEFETRIKSYLKNFEEFYEKIIPFTKTSQGGELIENFSKNLLSHFPWYHDELAGLANGANIDLKQILALNMRVEILQLTKSSIENVELIEQNDENLLECSDFFVLNDDYHAIVHNEDGMHCMIHSCYIVTCKIIGKDYNGRKSPDESFTCYSYPGQLPGNAFGFNSSGFTFSVDALMPTRVAPYRFPRQIITRMILSAKNLQEIEDMITKTPIAFGVSINIGYFESDDNALKTTMEHNSVNFPQMFNYELAPSEKNNLKNLVSKHIVISKDASIDHRFSGSYSKNNYYHFNHYERLEINECVVKSSKSRRKRADKMRTPHSISDLLEMAYDCDDEEYPIYRSPSSNTLDSKIRCLATALFDMKERKMSIFMGDMSKSSPFCSISMETKL